MQGRQAALETAPETGLAVPAGQAAALTELKGQKLPAEHALQAADEEAPVAALNVPAGQGVGFTELKGQKDPEGQMTGPPEKQ
jgi:hypothetical protein